MVKGSYRLTVKLGPMPGKVYELARASVTLGRDAANDLVVNDSEVSRRHLQLTVEAEGCRVEDLASTNGTFIDGHRITQPALLKPGQVLGVGETVTLELSFTPDPDATLNVEQETSASEQATAFPTTPPAEAAPAEPAPEAAGFPMRWIVAGCSCLTLLACAAAVAVGIFLWNAPASFWHSLGF